MLTTLHHPISKFIIGTLLGIAIALLLTFNVLLLWVATGPRSLDRLSPYIAAALQPDDNSYSVRIGETWLIWDGWAHPIDLRLRNITVLTHDGQVFSRFPEISLGVDVLSLPRGHILPTSLTLTHPIISLFQNDDHSISFGFGTEPPPIAAPPPENTNAATVPFADVLAPLVAPDPDSGLHKLRSVTILGADVSIGNVHKGVFFKASSADIVFRRNRDGVVQAFTSARINYGSYESLLHADFTLKKNSPTINGTVAFNQLMPGTLATLFSNNKTLSALKLPISGKGTLALDRNGSLQNLHFMLEGGKGTLESDQLDGIIPITAFSAEGNLSNNAGNIKIDRLTASLDGGMVLAAQGTALLSNGDFAIQADCILKNVPAASIHMLWPPALSPESRSWVTSNISEGVVPQAEAHINIAMGDRAKPVLPKEDINASIELNGAKIRYLPDHPEVRNVKGTIHVDAVSLEADIASADYMKDTKLTGGKLLIDDLNVDNPYIKVSFNAESSAKDLVRLLGLPRLNHAARLNLNGDAAEGTAKGSATLGFHFFAPHDESGKTPAEPDISYDIAAELKDITQPGFMKKFDIKNADGSLSVKNTGLEFKGKGEVNGASVSESDIRYLFKPENGLDTFIEVTARAPVESLPRFGYPPFPFLKGGVLGVKGSVKQGEKLELSQASLDLTDATVTLSAIGWNKPDKEPATFELTAEKKEGVVTLPSLHLKGKDMDATGNAELNKDLSGISTITLDKFLYGKTDLDHVLYEPLEGGFRLEAEGKTADARHWVEGDSKEDSTFSFEHFPAFQFKGQIGTLIMGKDRTLLAVKGDAACDIHLCSGADISGTTTDGKPFSFRIMRNPKGTRQLSIHAESAGAFLKAVNTFDGMEGGDLTIIGNYDDSGEASLLKGKADITEHTIKDAPVLARILSLASLTGFLDTMQGNGIRFTKLHAPFTLTKDVITLQDAKTHGDAIGMTASGTITFPKRTLDLQGTIVPSYTLNNIVGKVPLIGPMLTGGEGQGVFAARYSVKGLEKDPDVTVNPLSILTPGFLRGVFDIFDQPEKKNDSD